MGVWGWSRYVYEHPAHQNLSYEKAPYSRRLHYRVGPNRLRITSVARTDRDGAVNVEDGAGRESKSSVPFRNVIAASGAWLDTAQITMSSTPGLIEPLHVRVFDHETRELLAKDHPQSGWRMVDADTLQIYRLGAKLPEAIDLWFRLHSYDAREQPVTLAAVIGASCQLDGVTVALNDIKEGFSSYGPDQGLVGAPSNHDCSLVVQVTGPAGTDTKLQLTAVAKDGERVPMHGAPMYLHPRSGIEVLHMAMNLHRLDHFEVRRFGGREKFFFDGIRLPKTSSAAFQPPPTVTTRWAEGDSKQVLADFSPLHVQLGRRAGHWANGTGGNDSGIYVLADPNGPRNVETETTVTYKVMGLSSLKISVESAEGDQPWTALPSGDGGSSSNQQSQTGYQVYSIPAERLRQMRVSIGSNP